MNKLKKVTGTAMVCACMMTFPFAAFAAAGDHVTFEQGDDNRVTVSVGMGNAYKEQVTGVSLKLKVDVEKGKEKISFTFPSELGNAVTGTRYSNGYLYIYVAGDQGLFDADDDLVLGELTAEATTSTNLKAKISYAAGSFKTSNAAYGGKEVNPDDVSDPVWVTQDGIKTPDESKPGESKPDESKPDESKPGSGESGSGSGTGGSESGSGSGSGAGSSGSGSGSGSSSGSDSDDSSSESGVSASARRKPVKTDSSIPSYVVRGTWTQTDGKWKFRDASGKEYKNSWAAVVNPYANTAAGQSAFDWFRFDADGNMLTGWVTDPDGNIYYLNPVSDNTKGRMMTGWQWIADANGVKRCYYFNPVSDGFRGKLLKSTVIEGSTVNADGAWTMNGDVQTR